MEQLTLFDLSAVAPAAPPPKIDPYWDEIVLSPGAVEETGQLSLLYDDSTEPPDPDDYPSREAFNKAWDEWEKRNPQLVSEVRAMSDECDRNSAPEQMRDCDRNSAPEQPQPKLRYYWDEVEFDEDDATDTADALYPYNCVREQVTHDTFNTDIVREQKPVTQVAPEHTHWVEEYWVQRREQKYKYYRYCWMEGRKIRRCHIGGNVKSRAARETKAAVESAIAFGESPSEIEKLIRQKSGVRS